MPALAITITLAFSFVLGCLFPLAERRASRIFNKQSAGGLLLFLVAVLSTFGLSILTIALIGTALGTYTPETYRITLAPYVAGLALFALLNRLRRSRG